MWEVNGIRGHGDMPSVAGQFSGTLLVCGSGRSLWDDLGRAPAGDLMLVNDAAWMIDRPAVHMASLHADLLPFWSGYRKTKRRENHLHLHGPAVRHPRPVPLDLIRWEFENGTCYSGIFAAVVGLALGYGRAILCGVPQTGDGYCWSPEGRTSNHDDKGIWNELRAWAPALRGRITSMSGKTRDLLGEPA